MVDGNEDNKDTRVWRGGIRVGLFGIVFWWAIIERVSYRDVCCVGKWQFKENDVKKLVVASRHGKGGFKSCC